MTPILDSVVRVPLSALKGLSDGECRGIDAHGRGRDTVLVVHSGGRVHAYEDRCPHLDTPMAWRKDAYLNGDRTRIVCAAHGAQFDIETGQCLLGPCLGQHLTRVEIEPEGASPDLGNDATLATGLYAIALALRMT